MQVAKVKIQNFKGIKDLELSFEDEAGRIRPLTLLLGDNGSGKTTVLQAIALLLSVATKRTEKVEDLEWPGFLMERVSSQGQTFVELEIVFEADELAAISEANEHWRRSFPAEKSIEPQLSSNRVTLHYSEGRLRVRHPSPRMWFQGRYWVNELLKTQPNLRSLFQRIGDVFWFDQNRNLMTIGSAGKRGIESLREFLVGWWGVHTSPQRKNNRPDYLAQLEKHFAVLFPGTRFVGVEPKPGYTSTSVENLYFLIERDGRTYDLAEMSSGEQAIFPLLYEFVRLSIARSVVLIDELELHLHPPQQQALLSALRQIGPDCQFIVTTHSPYLEQVTPNEEEIRLPGGHRCL